MTEEAKVKEYAKKLEEHEAKEAEVAKQFSVDEVLAESGKIHERLIPALNRIVKFGSLTLGDLPEINKAGSDEEKAQMVLWKMLHKADSKITLDQVKRFPLETATAILTTIATPLQETTKQLQSGLKSTAKPNYSA